MADTPVVIQETPAKPATQSNAMWASFLTMIIGFLSMLGLPAEVAEFLKASVMDIIGIVVSILGVYGMWASARRSTKIKL